MIALDTSVLVYAFRSDNPFHALVVAAIDRLIERALPWGVPIVCVHEFLAVSTNARAFREPTPLELAFRQIEGLLEQPGARLLVPTKRHLPILRELAESAQASGGRLHDARVAASCIEHGVTQLWSADRDFGAWPQLNVRTPRDLLQVD